MTSDTVSGGCPDLDPNWPGSNGEPRGPRWCVLYPNCECGDRNKRAAVARTMSESVCPRCLRPMRRTLIGGSVCGACQ